MTNKIKYILFAFIVFAMTIAEYASAHVKWFVPEKEVINNPAYFSPAYSITDSASIIWVLAGMVMVLCAWYLDRKIKSPQLLINFGKNYEQAILKVFQFLVGLFLIAISIGWKIVLVPTLGAIGYVVWSLLVLQVVVGLMLIFNLKPKIAAILLAILYTAVSLISGLDVLLENVLIIGIAVYIYLANTKQNEFGYKFVTIKTKILRVSAGISLIVLAFTEKFLNPELSMYFLQEHNWNFMQRFGFTNFTDPLFILSVGAMETIFGIILIAGKLTRITTVALAGFFAISVVSMFVTQGKWEVEDLVIYAAAIILVIYSDK